jgi:Met-zincin/Domain of unknown function (DUF5117)
LPDLSRRLLATLAFVLLLSACTPASKGVRSDAASSANSDQSALPSVAKITEGLARHAGFLDLYLDSALAKVYWRLDVPDAAGNCGELLYVESLRSGLGSNPVGLDRGQLGAQRVVELRRVGRRLLLVAPNLDFRARTDNRDERLAVEGSFAQSVLWSGKVIAEGANSGFLVDLTPFLVRDAHGSAATLERSGQGTFQLDSSRSFFEPANTLAFPDNVELEATLTLKSSKPGPLLRGVTPDPHSVTLVQHHSFIRLPDDTYRPRSFDPQSGSFGTGFADYAAPLDAKMQVRWLERHRLEKLDPSAETSPAKEPIVYYVDRGAPPRIREALIDGASWWTAAFEAAGFENAFRVELLPEGAHPLDLRYNVIQWVHRRTRGWSYGGTITDPRTGEILKGHVSLGSLRVRQDRRIFEGLLGTDHSGTGRADDPVELALARIRQLSAHEVGHTLGLSHNFAASSYGRASVMDYPAPWLHVDAATKSIDSSRAYGTGVGAWDLQAIRYAYTQASPTQDESEVLAAILTENRRRMLVFITDRDARPAGGAHPLAHLWDNGSDPATELDNVMEVRRAALHRFGTQNVRKGRAQADLAQVFVPVYLYHRFQVEAAIKLIGAVDYDYAVVGRSETHVRAIDATTQRRALQSVLRTLDPAELDIDEATLSLLLPPPPGAPAGNRELFGGQTGPTFDAMGAAAAAADEVLRLLLHPERCMRLVDSRRRDEAQLGLAEVLDVLRDHFFPRATTTARLRPILHTEQRLYLNHLVALSSDKNTPHAVRVVCEEHLRDLHRRLERAAESPTNANARVLAGDLQRFFEKREWTAGPSYEPLSLPPGSPIGSESPACVFGSVSPAS